MRIRPLILLFLPLLGQVTLAQTKMTIGDGRIDGTRLEPYEHTWRQCSFQDGQWQNRGDLTEKLVAIGERVFRHRQIGRQADGTESRSDTYFDRSTFAPLRMEVEVVRNGERLIYSERTLDPDGYTGFAVQGDEAKDLQGGISSQMLHGGAMGLPLASMDYHNEPVEFLASMMAFDGTYDVVAEWVGKESLQFDDKAIEAWLIDVKWHHRESGDIYPPGPDASGGRYWVVPKPPVGFPYVPRYQTDTYAVEFIHSVCPRATSE